MPRKFASKFVRNRTVAGTLHSAVLERTLKVFLQVVHQRTKKVKMRLHAVKTKEAAGTLSVQIFAFQAPGVEGNSV
jgi:hypothetical protein